VVRLGQAVVVEDDGVEGLAADGGGQVLGDDARAFGREGVQQLGHGRRADEGVARALRLQRLGQGQRAHDVAAAHAGPGVDDEQDRGPVIAADGLRTGRDRGGRAEP
jgi:hypothetical protein